MKHIIIFLFLIAWGTQIFGQKSGCISGNCENGTGTFVWGSETQWAGDKYSGEWLNGMRHGNGTYVYATGAKYIGEYKNNQMDGEGTYIWANGDKYIGGWQAGKRHGAGDYTFADGSKKTGVWENGVYKGVNQNSNVNYNSDVKQKTECISGDCVNGYGVYTWESGEKYEGYWKNYKRNGQGTNNFASGAVYKGEWKDDLKNGYGAYTYASSSEYDKYNGDWVDDKMTGYGTFVYKNGQKYIGEFTDNLFNGQGTMYYKDGTTESGVWENDVFKGVADIADNGKTEGCIYGNCTDGYGIYTWSTGEKYEGYWEDLKRNGQGTNYFPSGSIYVGLWKDDKKHGSGTFTYKKESEYEKYQGDFFEDELHGQGLLDYKNGDKYEGSFLHNLFDGEGTMTYADGTTKSGIWKDDNYVGKSSNNYGCISGDCSSGYGTYTWESGEKYEGYWKGSKLHGQGTFFASSGDKYIGSFENGTYNGQGTYIFAIDSKKYIGEWKNGMYNGKGTLYLANGTTQSGIWKDNNFVGEDVETGTAPTLSWLTPEYFTSNSSVATMNIKVCVQSSTELKNAQVFVNGQVQIDQATRGYNVVTSACDYTVERTVTLKPGENKIKIVVENQYGKTTSDERSVTFSANSQQKRYALIIGNGDYTSSPLKNPTNDATAIAKELQGMGFEVSLSTNVSLIDMKKSVRSFGEKLAADKGVGLFYYAGHGMQLNGQNYLIPVDAKIEKEQDVEFEALDLQRVLSEMDYARNDLNIVILDACRNNPFARSFRAMGNSGLSTTNAPSGTFIAYATAPGSVAADGTGQNGLYTQELLTALKEPGLKIEEVFKKVRTNVYQKSNKLQTPWESNSIFGDFFFKPQN